MKMSFRTALTVLALLASVSKVSYSAAGNNSASDMVSVYEVNRKVCDFPEGEDFSTPEAAYATINRLSASGKQAFWRRVSVKKLAQQIPAQEGKQEIQQNVANRFLNTNIIEVRILQGRYAYVIAREPPTRKLFPELFFDTRSFELEDGRWLNAGNSGFESLEKARAHFGKLCGQHAEKPKRPRIDDPETYLKPFIDFLQTNGQEPKAFVMKALAKHKIVIMGEIHHRPRYWAFNSSLVADPDFTKQVGTIYMELPSNDQVLIDEFLAGEKCDRMLVIKMLRDMLWMGWPDQPMLDFFIAVWNANQNQLSERRLRIVLVDVERPWGKIKQRGDWRQYDVDRDRYMADNIIKDIQKHPDEKRNSLFLVGVGHTALNFNLSFLGDYPLETAGWHLQQKLGSENVYAIMQHRCVMTNMGRVDGRLCLGLFDSAFAKLDNKPMAFTLETGPFGEQMYDGQPDTPVWSRFKDGFNAYLFLGELETELFSSLIDGFYTDEFVIELERRFRIMNGKGWAEAYKQEKSDAESFIKWMSGSGGSWGNPRQWRNELGPIDAWKYGDNWEEEFRKKEHEFALEHPEVIKAAATKLFDEIRNADYEHHSDGSDWRNFLPETEYQVHHHFPVWVQWVCKTFRENPIQSVELGEVSRNAEGLPSISYVVTLRDGRQLKGILPFKYMPRGKCWMGIEGIDWHLNPGR